MAPRSAGTRFSAARLVRGPALAALAAAAGLISASAPAAIIAPADPACPTSHFAGDTTDTPDSLTSLLRQAEADAIREGEPPAARRTRLLERIRQGDACFVHNPTPEQLQRLSQKYGARNPSEKMVGRQDRFFLQGSAWLSNGQTVTNISGQGRRINRLTYSFPADGVVWTPAGTDPPLQNDLNFRLDGRFGQAGRDYGRELFRQAFAAWKLNAGVDYAEVCDDNAPLSLALEPAGGPRGDIRLGAYSQGRDFGVLAFNYYPESGGDMVLNSDYFTPFEYYSGGGSTQYRYLRNVIAHEHGHGLGFRHVVPCSETKLMEPFSSTAYDMMQRDEKRGAQNNYGDRFSGNHTPQNARDLNLQHVILPNQPPSDPRYASTGANTKQALPLDYADAAAGLVPHSAIERDLSTNGRINGAPTDPPSAMTEYDDPAAIVNPTGQDWFKFSLLHAYPVVITVDPTGLLYSNGPQDIDCQGTVTPIDADKAGNLNFELFSVDPNTGVLTHILDGAGEMADPGVNERIDAGLLQPGTYMIRVFDIGPNPISLDGGVNPDGSPGPQRMPTQLYDLSVRLGNPNNPNEQLKFPPLAIAGVDKIVPVSISVPPDPPILSVASFIGNISSRVQEASTAPLTQSVRNWEWDLDGDGTFETNYVGFETPAPGQPTIDPRSPFGYAPTENKIVPVTLRVTDANGQKSQDTIYVKYVGAPITVTSVTPAFGVQGQTTAITIVGTGLGAITDASQITFSGLGVTCIGIPRSNAAGTQLDNISARIDITAATGFRDITVSDGCGSAMLAAAFEVRQAIPPPGNDVCSGTVRWPDDFGCKDFDNIGATTETPQTYPGTPCVNQIIEGDVWYAWRVPDCTSATVAAVPVPPPGMQVRMAVYRPLFPIPLGCPPLAILATCGPGFPVTFAVVPGELLLFRVGGAVPGQTGMGCIQLSPTADLGTCCIPATGECTCVNQTACTSGVWTAMRTCTPDNPCEGHCCLNTGTCLSTRSRSECAAAQGIWAPGTTCSPNPCPQLGACCSGSMCTAGILETACIGGAGDRFLGANTTCSPVNNCGGACCRPDGSCDFTTQNGCFNTAGNYAGDGSACTPGTCPQPGACCNGTVCAVNIQGAACIGAGFRFLGENSACTPNNQCVGACCGGTGACDLVTPDECLNTLGSYTGDGTVCAPANPCPQPGACCAGTTCAASLASACPMTSRFLGPGTACGPNNPCVGACCQPSGGCSLTQPADCTTVVGIYSGDGTVCSPNTCPQPGACCNGTTCTRVLQSACAVGSQFLGENSTCGPTTCTPGACCDAGDCTIALAANCHDAAVRFLGPGSVCGPTGAPCVIGACCIDDLTCRQRIAADCTAPTDFAFIPAGTCTPQLCTRGACCSGTSCATRIAETCAGAGERFLSGTSCTPSPCIPGACCRAAGCQTQISADCPAGTPFLPATTCSPTNCTPGVCCTAAACTLTQQSLCTGANTRFLGAGVCTTSPCTPGACCVTNTQCELRIAADCTGASVVAFLGAATVCSPSACVAGACCDGAACSATVAGACTAPAAVFLTGATCAADTCTPGACCTGGACTTSLQFDCTGMFLGPATTCSPNPCIGACCTTATGACVDTPQSVCIGPNQSWTPGVTCNPIVCRFVGACCNGTTCAVTFENDCISGGGLFQGPMTVCGSVGNPTTCCPANVNDIGGVTVQDIFDYLAFWFALDPRAEFDGVPGIGLQDLFDFLAAWFAGCDTLVNGACCTGTTCTVSLSPDCTNGGGTFQGVNTVCGTIANPTTCCRVNINGIDGVTIEDIFAYLQLWFALDPQADFDGVGGVTIDDLFIFLQLYFAGCG